ncbi:MAG TPA: M20/M25/M40 family metallo-hydrolase [Steroidobacteraceae bacterium]|nr:M20/M25/M40 family metallo-hydrolase [Steroidobacteraceae bacterium]
MKLARRHWIVAILGLASSSWISSSSAAPSAGDAAFRDLYRELIEINTTLSAGSCTQAAEAMKAHLTAAGFADHDMQLLIPKDRPRDGTLIALLPGREPRLKPVMLMAHMDVVEARREDWTRDPFKLVEENGWYYARGAVDDKAMAAIFVDSMIRYRQERFRPRRGIKLALTCGEESPQVFSSVAWLVRTNPAALDAAMALNEGGDGELGPDGKPLTLQIQAGEKVYQDFALETTDVGGHSSRPTHENAITRLSAGLIRLDTYRFPVTFLDATRGYFQAQAKMAPPTIAGDIDTLLKDPGDEAAADRIWTFNPAWNGMLRTTCVVTQISGGHAVNALPQHAVANVNCRILPGEPIQEVQKRIVAVLADPKIAVSPVNEPGEGAPSPPLSRAVMDPARQVAQRIWPGVPLIPTIVTWATDGRYLNAAGVPTYGLSGLFHDAEGSHMHGLNERIRVESLLNGRRFLYEVVKIYADQDGPRSRS